MNNVDLDNGDKVGVACPWDWPDLFEGISKEKIRAVQTAISEGKYRADSRSSEWVGNIILTVLEMDPCDGSKKRASKMLKAWLGTGALVEVEGVDSKRNPRRFVEVGRWLTD